MTTLTPTPTQQELNVRFAKALGWIELEREGAVSRWPNWKWQFQEQTETWGSELPNYFAPENFHLVRAAVGELDDSERQEFKHYFCALIDPTVIIGRLEISTKGLLSPVEHIITAYLKVKGVN